MSTSAAAALPRTPLRRSPPPLSLDDCGPRAPAVFHPASPPTSPGAGATSFVFTSSRTKQWPSASTSPDAVPPPARRPRTPVSATASTSTNSTVRSLHKPALTATQLARHSEGATDARRLLGPNMRAAGFVHLSDSVGRSSGSSAATSPASSPGWQEIAGPSNYMGSAPVQLTPTDPPPFPPLVFVPSSAVKQMSMWEYQKWPPGQTPGLSSPHHPHFPSNIPAETFHARSVSEGAAAAAMGLGITPARSPSHSPQLFSSSEFNAVPAPSRSTSFSASRRLLSPLSAMEKGKERERDGLDEYPFPRALPSPSSHSSGSGQRRLSGAHSRRSRDESPELASNAAWAREPGKAKLRAKDKNVNRDKRTGDRVAGLIAERVNAPQPHARPAAHIVQPHAPSAAYALSVTELCEPGFAWSTPNVDVFSPALRAGARVSGEGAPSPPEREDVVEKAEEEQGAPKEAVVAPAEAALVEEEVEAQRLVEHEREKRNHRDHRDQRHAEKKHIAVLVAAHRERDEDHVRYVAAEREKEREKGKERAVRRSPHGSPKGSGRSSPVHEKPERERTSPKRSGRTSPKEREHRGSERGRTSPGHKERKSRRQSPKLAMHKTKSIVSDITNVSDAETMVGDAIAGDILVA